MNNEKKLKNGNKVPSTPKSVSEETEAHARMVENLRASRDVIRRNIHTGFQGILENGKHYLTRKEEVKRVTGRVAGFNEWVRGECNSSPRTARRHIKFYKSLCLARPDILELVDVGELAELNASCLQKAIKLDNFPAGCTTRGEFVRLDVEPTGLYLVFGRGRMETRYNLKDLSTRKIDSLVQGKSVKDGTGKSSANDGASTAGKHRKVNGGESDEIRKLRMLVAELQAENAELEAENEDLKATSAKQATRITEVELERDSLRQKLYARTPIGEQALRNLEAILRGKSTARMDATPPSGTQISELGTTHYPSSSAGDPAIVEMELDADGKGVRISKSESAFGKTPQFDSCEPEAEAV